MPLSYGLVPHLSKKSLVNFHFLLTTLCHVQIPGRSFFFFYDKALSNSLRQRERRMPLPTAAILWLQDSRLQTEDLTDDWLLLLWAAAPTVGGHSPWLTKSLQAARLRLTVTLLTPTHRCLPVLLQSLCLHSWNIWLCQGSICNRVIARIQKWYFITPCLIISITSYVSRVNWSNPTLDVVVVSIEKGAFRSPPTTVANFTIAM